MVSFCRSKSFVTRHGTRRLPPCHLIWECWGARPMGQGNGTADLD